MGTLGFIWCDPEGQWGAKITFRIWVSSDTIYQAKEHRRESRHGVKELNSFFSDTLIEWKCPVISLPHISGWSFIIGNHHQWKTHQHETPKANEITKGIKNILKKSEIRLGKPSILGRGKCDESNIHMKNSVSIYPLIYLSIQRKRMWI